MDLAVKAIERDTLTRYGEYHDLHGVQVPAWLITQGADATSEALLGLAPYVRATGSRAATRVCRRLARGIAEFHAGSTTQWPFRALLPWAGSLDDWHAWGSEMAQGLAAASRALHDPALLRPAVGDTAGFTAQLLTATGPDNGWLPVPLEKVQIAYGADARVRACHDVGVATGRPGIRRLAGVAAGWFFGANTAGVPVYNPATGVTFDGVDPDGRLNRNSGAESTIHGLLTMQVLDASPELARLAKASATIGVRDGLSVIEAEVSDADRGRCRPDPRFGVDRRVAVERQAGGGRCRCNTHLAAARTRRPVAGPAGAGPGARLGRRGAVQRRRSEPRTDQGRRGGRPG